MVTMSTVGYGDIVCTTNVGRVFQIMFLGVGLVRPLLGVAECVVDRAPLVNPHALLTKAHPSTTSPASMHVTDR